MRKLLATLLTAGTILIVVMAAMDRRPGLWQRSPKQTIQPTVDTTTIADSLTIADTTQSVLTADTLPTPDADSLGRDEMTADDDGRK
ncbi:MAG: hypothetical protein J6K81_00130 [Rikenellaceae bacterium]|nr:hypothetical protein [Rikenellaceae bacterium]